MEENNKDISQESSQKTSHLQTLFESFIQQYRNLAQFMNALDLPPEIKVYANQNFDQGYLWVKEGFIAMSQKEQKTETKSEETIQ